MRRLKKRKVGGSTPSLTADEFCSVIIYFVALREPTGQETANLPEDQTYVFGKLDDQFLMELPMIKLTTSVSLMQARTSPTSRVFYELAARHGGYFTTAEASPAGISYRQLSYHVASGALERTSHGVYR